MHQFLDFPWENSYKFVFVEDINSWERAAIHKYRENWAAMNSNDSTETKEAFSTFLHFAFDWGVRGHCRSWFDIMAYQCNGCFKQKYSVNEWYIPVFKGTKNICMFAFYNSFKLNFTATLRQSIYLEYIENQVLTFQSYSYNSETRFLLNLCLHI